MAQVCVDASFIVKLLVNEEFTQTARALWRRWSADRTEIVGPPLLSAETTSVLRRLVHFRHIAELTGEAAFQSFLLAERAITEHSPHDLQQRAWVLAKTYNRPRAYDAQYLAVAESLNCALWTADERLKHAVPVPWVRWVGDA